MTGVAVADKIKVILVGGMGFNIPDQLKDTFDIVKHISQGSKYNTLPKADFVFVITQFANHNIVDQVKRESKIPVVWLRQGWATMKEDLQKRSILPPDAKIVEQEPAPLPTPLLQGATLGLSEAEIWKKFGEKMVEACRGALKVGEKVSEKELLDVLAMAGPPPEDCKLFLPRFQMMGIVAPTKNGLWRLASSEVEEYEDEGEVEETPPQRAGRKSAAASERTEAENRLRRIPGTPSLVVRLIAGLNPGPYLTKKSIYKEMRKYQEFAGLTDFQVRGYVERAIKLKIVDDTQKDLYINRRDDMALTRLADLPQDPAEPSVPEVKPRAPILDVIQPIPPPTGLSAEEAQKKWCFAVEKVRQSRARVGDILTNCRMEWMGGNNVLAIFLPAVFSNCQKFLESTENWGTITKAVQAHFAPDTVVRFMLDNGLRG